MIDDLEPLEKRVKKMAKKLRNKITFHTSQGHMEYDMEEDPNISIDMNEIKLIVDECLSEEVFFQFVRENFGLKVDKYGWENLKGITDHSESAPLIKKAFNSTVRVMKQDIRKINQDRISEIMKAIEDL